MTIYISISFSITQNYVLIARVFSKQTNNIGSNNYKVGILATHISPKSRLGTIKKKNTFDRDNEAFNCIKLCCTLIPQLLILRINQVFF